VKKIIALRNFVLFHRLPISCSRHYFDASDITYPVVHRGKGTIVMLIGPSSTGKTTIGKNIQKNSSYKKFFCALKAQSLIHGSLKIAHHSWKIVNDIISTNCSTRFLYLEDNVGYESVISINLITAEVKQDNIVVEHPDSQILISSSKEWSLVGTDDIWLEMRKEQLRLYYRDFVETRDFQQNELFYDWYKQKMDDNQYSEPYRLFSLFRNDPEGLVIDAPIGLKDLINKNIPKPKKWDLEFLQKIVFDRAICNSIQGIPTVMDLVPSRLTNTCDEFVAAIKEYAFSGPIFTVQVFLPIYNIMSRMHSRNLNPNNQRKGLFPLEQLFRLFRLNPTQSSLGQVNKEDLELFLTTFGTLASNSEKRKIRDKLDDGQFFIPQYSFDLCVTPLSIHDSEKIAQRILSLSRCG